MLRGFDFLFLPRVFVHCRPTSSYDTQAQIVIVSRIVKSDVRVQSKVADNDVTCRINLHSEVEMIFTSHYSDMPE